MRLMRGLDFISPPPIPLLFGTSNNCCLSFAPGVDRIGNAFVSDRPSSSTAAPAIRCSLVVLSKALVLVPLLFFVSLRSPLFFFQVKAHKTHLVARSEYFRSMFRKGAMRESETSEVRRGRGCSAVRRWKNLGRFWRSAGG